MSLGFKIAIYVAMIFLVSFFVSARSLVSSVEQDMWTTGAQGQKVHGGWGHGFGRGYGWGHGYWYNNPNAQEVPNPNGSPNGESNVPNGPYGGPGWGPYGGPGWGPYGGPGWGPYGYNNPDQGANNPNGSNAPKSETD